MKTLIYQTQNAGVVGRGLEQEKWDVSNKKTKYIYFEPPFYFFFVKPPLNKNFFSTFFQGNGDTICMGQEIQCLPYPTFLPPG